MKYRVFKFHDAISVTDGYVTFKVDQEVMDAVVIRLQDVFAPPALDSYANSIAIALELIASDGEQWKSLRAIADYFSEQASISWDTNRKIPD